MKNGKLRSSNEAVVGIVVAVLLIGLTVSVIALMQTQYVPKWMKQKEAEHMEDVMDQFTLMKFAIDTQIANKIETPIVTSMTLGSKELPYLVSQRSYGQLEILSHTSSECQFVITKTDDIVYTYPVGTIRYSSSNAYYLDQSFILEAGSLITSQSDGYDMTIKPSFSIRDEGGIIITINFVDIKGIGGKIQSSGYGSTPIMTEYSEELFDNTKLVPPVDEFVKEIKITSNYPKEWASFMNWSLKNQNFYNPDDPDDDYDIDIVDNLVTITFNVVTKPKLVLKVHEINAQIGPGWID